MSLEREFPGRPDLEPGALRQIGHHAVDWMVDYLASLGEERRLYPGRAPEDVTARFDEPLPEEGMRLNDVLQQFREMIVEEATHLQHPGNFGYIPNSASFIGILAEALAATLNQNVSLIRGGPSAAVVEGLVVRWLRNLIGYPDSGGGVLTSGGSLANLMALALARECSGPGNDLVYYLSEEIHSSMLRGLRFLGVPATSICSIGTDDSFRMKPDDLLRAIESDRRGGRHPAVVVASSGTIGSGAVDPLEELADICDQHGLWLHVDGAYGALAAAAPSGAWIRRGLARAQSLSMDPHKWLFVPIDASCLLVRDPDQAVRFFTELPEYLKVSSLETKAGIPHPMQQTVELSRRFRALKLWMTIKTVGARTLREKIEQHLTLAGELTERLERASDYELLAPTMLSTVAFRLRGNDELDGLNQELLERLNRRPGLFLSHSRLRGTFAIRVCITHLRTGEADIERLWTALREETRALLS
jgi:aromatic-L-amino-acid decarboxylase